eukprot:s105_g24.t1
MKNGQQVTTATCEDPTEAKTEQRLLEPIIKDPQGFDEEKLKKGMIKEMTSMVNQGVFEEITLDQATEEEKRNIIGSKWVHRNKGDEVRSRIVGLGYDEVIKDADDVYASTPLFAILRVNVGGSQVSPYGEYYGGWFYHGQPDQYNQYQYHHGYQSPEWHPGFGSIAAGCPSLPTTSWSYPYQELQIATFLGFHPEAASSSSSQPFPTRPVGGLESPEPPWPSSLIPEMQAPVQRPRRARQAQVQDVTTLVLHNVPARLTAREVLDIFRNRPGGGFQDIDFFYLPYRSKQRRYSRYCFINFRSAEAARRFRERWHGSFLMQGEPAIALGNAHTQGLAANLYLHNQVLTPQAGGQLSTPLVFREGRLVDAEATWRQISQRLTDHEWHEVYRQANFTIYRAAQAQGTPALSSGSRTGTVYHL